MATPWNQGGNFHLKVGGAGWVISFTVANASVFKVALCGEFTDCLLHEWHDMLSLLLRLALLPLFLQIRSLVI